MNSVSIVNSHGFSYTGDCKPCAGKYGIYKNPSFPSFEIRINKKSDYVRIKKGNQLVSQANSSTLESELKRLNLVREGQAV